MTVDDRLLERFRREHERNRLVRDTEPLPLEPGGGGGDSGGMDGLAERVTRVELRLDGVEQRLGGVEGRIDRLESRMESRMDGLDARLRNVEQELKANSGKLDLLTSQIVSKLPSWWQIPMAVGATVTLLALLAAGALRLVKAGWL